MVSISFHKPHIAFYEGFPCAAEDVTPFKLNISFLFSFSLIALSIEHIRNLWQLNDPSGSTLV